MEAMMLALKIKNEQKSFKKKIKNFQTEGS